MGMLIDGRWCADTDRFMQDGVFAREASGLRNPAPQELLARMRCDSGCLLVISKSCPWSHRVALVRALKGLRGLPVVIAGGPRVEGYALPAGVPGIAADHVHQLYSATDAAFTGRATVPLVWDPRSRTVLANDSALIARVLDLMETACPWSLRPDHLAGDIDALNTRLYADFANAVYRAGFAQTQAAYDEAVQAVFVTLRWLEAHLSGNRFLLGQVLTEADVFLFPTLVRFDAIYAPLFRCTRRRLVEHPAVWAYARDILSLPRVSDTIDPDADRAGYFANDTDNNPHGIIPVAPEIDWTAPHERARLGEALVWSNGGPLPLSQIDHP